MGQITRLLISISRRWWGVALVLALNIAAFAILFNLEDRFEVYSGVPTFDTQNDLTITRMTEQLPQYQGEARDAYFAFAAFDFLFPFIAGLNLAVLWALFLRTNSWKVAARLLVWNLPLVAFLATLFDWGENISLLTVLNAGVSPDTALLETVLIFKRLKLTMLSISFGMTSILFIAALINWITRAVRHRAKIQLKPGHNVS